MFLFTESGFGPLIFFLLGFSNIWALKICAALLAGSPSGAAIMGALILRSMVRFSSSFGAHFAISLLDAAVVVAGDGGCKV